ncbi:helix-turn-helix transcriptional regulator [Bdellovibrionales bacterium]|nr:helix-turn-helix transcriptional regulator [Bdellovibrionales bacterium]
MKNELSARAPDQLGVALKRLRKMSGMTQSELANKAGVQQRTISKIENGQQNTEVSTLFNLCAVLGLELVIRPRGKGQKTPKWMDK